jgi:hypothetical protein
VERRQSHDSRSPPTSRASLALSDGKDKDHGKRQCSHLTRKRSRTGVLGMAKIIFFLKRKADVTPEEFREHYEKSHVRLAKKYIGHLIVGYNRNYPTFAILNPSGLQPGTPPPAYDIGYDCITEMHVSSQEALEEIMRIFNDPVINPILAEDELKFLNRAATVMIAVDEVNTGTKVEA